MSPSARGVAMAKPWSALFSWVSVEEMSRQATLASASVKLSAHTGTGGGGGAATQVRGVHNAWLGWVGGTSGTV